MFQGFVANDGLQQKKTIPHPPMHNLRANLKQRQLVLTCSSHFLRKVVLQDFARSTCLKLKGKSAGLVGYTLRKNRIWCIWFIYAQNIMYHYIYIYTYVFTNILDTDTNVCIYIYIEILIRTSGTANSSILLFVLCGPDLGLLLCKLLT